MWRSFHLQAICSGAARTFFSVRPDKEWSLTDCISFVVMNERGITDALTSDHHFEQAGFQILLKD
jgi:predicted nucleic acid-binding protein